MHTLSLIIALLLASAPEHSQSTWLPLEYVDSFSHFVSYVTYPEDFSPTDDDPLENHIVGYVVEVLLDFRSSDDGFVKNPEFCIYLRTPENEFLRVDIGPNNITANCPTCLAARFRVQLSGPGWLECYCFPKDYATFEPSLEQMGGSQVHAKFYVRF